jgi:hypothetical protein
VGGTQDKVMDRLAAARSASSALTLLHYESIGCTSFSAGCYQF